MDGRLQVSGNITLLTLARAFAFVGTFVGTFASTFVGTFVVIINSCSHGSFIDLAMFLLPLIKCLLIPFFCAYFAPVFKV